MVLGRSVSENNTRYTLLGRELSGVLALICDAGVKPPLEIVLESGRVVELLGTQNNCEARSTSRRDGLEGISQGLGERYRGRNAQFVRLFFAAAWPFGAWAAIVLALRDSPMWPLRAPVRACD